jgi:hypothetical protein
MGQKHKTTLPPGFGRPLIQFTVVVGVTIFAILSSVVRKNPEHLFDLKQALAWTILIFVLSFSLSRWTGQVKPFFLILLLPIGLSLASLTLYLQHFSLQLKAPFSEFILAGVVVLIASVLGSLCGLLVFQKGNRKFRMADIPSAVTSSGLPRIKWVSYDHKLKEVHHGAIDVSDAKQIVDQYIKQAKPHYEYGEDAIAETSFQLYQSPEIFLYVSINGPNDISVTLQMERQDVPSILRFFQGHYYRELTLSSPDELVSLVEIFFQITPADFMPRLSQWSERLPRL